MSDDLHDFLRRASQRPPRKKKPPERPRPARRDSAEAVQAEIVSEHSGLSELPASGLGPGLDPGLLSDQQPISQQLRQTFEHGLGDLGAPIGAGESRQPAQPPSLVNQSLRLLTAPQGILQAVILNEIIQRPTHRWD